MKRPRRPFYIGEYEVGPHWWGDCFWESVAAARKVADDGIARDRLRRSRPPTKVPTITREEIERLDRADRAEEAYQERLAWGRTRHTALAMLEMLRMLPHTDRSFAIGQVVGMAMADVSETKQEAITRILHANDCALVALGYVWGSHRG